MSKLLVSMVLVCLTVQLYIIMQVDTFLADSRFPHISNIVATWFKLTHAPLILSCRSNPFYEPKTSSPPRLLAGEGTDTDVVSVQKRRAPAPPSFSTGSGPTGPSASSKPGPVLPVVGSVHPAGSGPVAAVAGRELSSSSSPKVTVTFPVCWSLMEAAL